MDTTAGLLLHFNTDGNSSTNSSEAGNSSYEEEKTKPMNQAKEIKKSALYPVATVLKHQNVTSCSKCRPPMVGRNPKPRPISEFSQEQSEIQDARAQRS